jgi:hypothetical protein
MSIVRNYLLTMMFLMNAIYAMAQATVGTKSPYTIHLTMDKIIVGKDSVVFKGTKNLVIATDGKSDTLRIATVGGKTIGICVNVSKVMNNKKVIYPISYTFLERQNNRWVVLKKFQGAQRYELLQCPEGLGKTKQRKYANEEYHCYFGEPQQFAAWFRMDVYRN